MHNAELAWDEDGNPRSSRFDDIYFSRAGGCAESDYVFLRHNRLPERFAAHFSTRRVFTIAETGFGTGLNFLLAWRAFALADLPADAFLHYLSAEAYPLSRADLGRALAAWPELRDYADELQSQYPHAVPGWHRLVLAGGRVRLTLLFGDATEQFAQADAPDQGLVDAWFLDGFAPNRNPELWNPRLFAQMARLSREGATLATYTAAGFVRRGLAEAGFVVDKVKGFGPKRDMLQGRFSGAPRKAEAPWFRWPAPPGERHALIIGAGLAGATTAHALAERGWRVEVFERHGRPGAEASGNLAGALYPHLHSRYTPATRLFLSAYGFALRQLGRLRGEGKDFPGESCGVLMLAHDEERRAQWQAILDGLGLPAAVLRELPGDALPWPAPHGGLCFPEGGWLEPGVFCAALLEHPQIRLHYGADIAHWRRDPAGTWVLLDGQDGGLARAPVLILATGSASYGQAWSSELPLGRVRGQVSYAEPSASSQKLEQVLCYEGYMTPLHRGRHCLGASYERGVEGYALSETEHEENREKLRRVLPELELNLPPLAEGRVGYRLSCRDHLPIVGPLPDFAAFREDYAEIWRGFAPEHYAPPRYQDGLYLNIAHGSRGLTTAPLSAEFLAAQLSGEPSPLPAALAEALCPARFLIRELQKARASRS
ncbi:MAG: bifunctional tRNA (5-methylaminomethyl-2-thiouridine)(34)-methyltransferase MnmD/FAD-dependent 5-carboxymethylaminomethyl-2-thiouridine(34) oxidoreductase MnmC [Gammaproteobacteria bacterium]|nr:bifunctional tRNA (5-methylaminomethyl-2-thiouridine)(34)-methyltransferase MnmD/FAD-dependent 5-carboxymethylaminomethyl-2-thiouridine(34) oxidoreductase MnmC [Gammaproteobacteria bacterium]